MAVERQREEAGWVGERAGSPIVRHFTTGTAILLTREAYTGPILPGSRWADVGTGGHQRGVPVTVIRLTAGGKVVFVRRRPGRAPNGERRYTLDETAFRRCYALEKQPPEASRALGYSAILVAAREGLIDEDRLESERRVLTVTNGLANGTAAALPGRLGTNGVATMTPPEAPGDPTPPEPTEALSGVDPQIAPEAPAPEVDPLDAFLAHGRATIEQLNGELARTEEDRELARLELEELDARLVAMRDRRERVTRAIEAALSVAQAPAPVEEVPTPEPVSGGTSLEDRAIIHTPPAVMRRGQQAWLTERLTAMPLGGRVTVSSLLTPFMEAFGFDRRDAQGRLSIVLSAVYARQTLGPGRRLERTGHGVYTVQRAEAPVEMVAPPAEPEAEPVNQGEAAVTDPLDDADTGPMSGGGPDFIPADFLDPGAEPAPAEAEAEAASATPTQRDWMRARFAERRLWPVRDLVPAFMATFGGDRDRATRNVSSILTEWVKHRPQGAPAIIRVSQGLYEAVG